MKALHFCTWLAVVMIVVSCKKKDDPAQNEKVYDNYSCLKPGNYWIYQEYAYNPNTGQMETTPNWDSCFVEKDTEINGNLYYKYCEAVLGGQVRSAIYLRDSLSYIVSSEGHIRFSSEDFTHVFRSYSFGPNAATPDTMQVTEKMTAKDVTVGVNAGTFTASVFTVNYKSASLELSLHTWYSKNVGMVKTIKGVFSYNTDYKIENRLVKYRVAP